MGVLVLAVSLPLKVLAAVVVFGPMIFFAVLLVRAARKDGAIQEERNKGGSSES
jgi:hypothetical protein